MAGFIQNTNNSFVQMMQKVKGPIRKMLRAGQEYDDLVMDSKLGVGPYEAQAIRSGVADDDSLYFASTYDINNSRTKAIGFFQKDYGSQKVYLQQMAKHREISKFLEILADEAIVYDENGFFAKAHTSMLDDLSEDKEEEVKDDLVDTFEHIYTRVYDFKDSTAAWRYFKKFLIEGILAFELVYSKEGDEIIKAIPIDPSQIVPDIATIDGKKTSVWTLYPNDPILTRTLPDTHVVYISYSKGDQDIEDISYVQSLIRSFNLFRTIENTAVIWNIMNSSYRMKTIVPVSGGRSKNEQAIGEIMGRFREDVQIDNNSGEVKIDGRPSLNLFRNYAIASKQGKQTEIESLQHKGYDMSNPELLKYWRDKLWEDSRIPFTRLQKDSQAKFISSTDNKDLEEMRFGKFINRLRSDFREILVKPLYLQMCLNNPDFEDDDYFRSKVSIRFYKENLFELYWTRENMKKDVEFVQSMIGLEDEEGNPKFSVDLLLEHYTTIDYDFLQKNKEMLEKKKEKEEESEEEGSDEGEEGNLSLDLGEDDEDLDTELDLGGDMGDTGGEDDVGGEDTGGDEGAEGLDFSNL